MRYAEDQPDNADSEALKARFQAASAGKTRLTKPMKSARVEKLVVPAINEAADSFVKDAKGQAGRALKDVLDPLAVNGYDQLADYRKRIEAAKKNDAAMA